MGKINNTFAHLNSKVKVKNSLYCSNCPIKLFCNENDYIYLGIGNLMSDTCFLIKEYNIKADITEKTSLTLLKNIYEKAIGKDLLETCYVTRFIKCNPKINKSLYDSNFIKCYNFLYHELCHYNFKNIIFVGQDSQYEKIKTIIKETDIKCFNITNVLVDYYDTNKYDRISDEINKIINNDIK